MYYFDFLPWKCITLIFFLKKGGVGVDPGQWGLAGHGPQKQKFGGLMPGQGPRLGCGFVVVRVCTRADQSVCLSHIGASLPLFLPPFPSLWK